MHISFPHYPQSSSFPCVTVHYILHAVLFCAALALVVTAFSWVSWYHALFLCSYVRPKHSTSEVKYKEQTALRSLCLWCLMSSSLSKKHSTTMHSWKVIYSECYRNKLKLHHCISWGPVKLMVFSTFTARQWVQQVAVHLFLLSPWPSNLSFPPRGGTEPAIHQNQYPDKMLLSVLLYWNRRLLNYFLTGRMILADFYGRITNYIFKVNKFL